MVHPHINHGVQYKRLWRHCTPLPHSRRRPFTYFLSAAAHTLYVLDQCSMEGCCSNDHHYLTLSQPPPLSTPSGAYLAVRPTPFYYTEEGTVQLLNLLAPSFENLGLARFSRLSETLAL